MIDKGREVVPVAKKRKAEGEAEAGNVYSPLYASLSPVVMDEYMI